MEARKRRESKRWEGGMGAEGRRMEGGQLKKKGHDSHPLLALTLFSSSP